MAKRLTRAERESIVFDHLKGKPTPGYNVTETKPGHYRVTPVKIEIDSDSEDEAGEPEKGPREGSKGPRQPLGLDPPPTQSERPSESEPSVSKENVLELLNLISRNLQDSDDRAYGPQTPTRSRPNFTRRRRLVL